MQKHKHYYTNRDKSPPVFINNTSVTSYYFYMADNGYDTGYNNGRSGDVTRGKSKGVKYIIKVL